MTTNNSEACEKCGKSKCDMGKEWCSTIGTKDEYKFCHGGETCQPTKTGAENLTIQGQTITVRHLGVKEAVVKVDDVERLLHQQRQQLIGEILEGVNGINHADCDCGRDSADCPAYKAHDKIVAVIKSKLTEE